MEKSLDPVSDADDFSINNFVADPPMHKFSRVSKLSVWYEVTHNCTSIKYPIKDVCSAGPNLSSKYMRLMSNFDKVCELECVIEALNDPNWKLAMDSEMNALISTQTWELAKLSSNRKSIDCKWVFKIKYRVDGSIKRYKARLVVKGFNQRE